MKLKLLELLLGNEEDEPRMVAPSSLDIFKDEYRKFQADLYPESLVPIGSYVLVRCTQAGVHVGVLRKRKGAECELTEARRLWRWYPAKGGLLSAVACYGIKENSIVGRPITIGLTEVCEYVLCTAEAEALIRAYPDTHE